MERLNHVFGENTMSRRLQEGTYSRPPWALSLRCRCWGCTRAAEPTEITIGFTLSQAGPYAVPAQHSQMTNYVMWSEEVNAQGGLFVKKFGKRLPVRLVHYDNRSDLGTGVRLYEKLATQDKVDLLLPPWGTAMNFAVAPLAERYKYPMIGVTVDSEKLKAMERRYFLILIQQSNVMSQALADFLVSIRQQANLKTVGMLYVGDLFGIEFSGVSAPLLKEKGFDLLTHESYPLGVKDLSATLKKLKAQNVNIYIGHSYPPDGFLATAQAQEADFSPKVFYSGVATIFPSYRDKFGSSIDGVIGPGMWNSKVPFGESRAYFDRSCSAGSTNQTPGAVRVPKPCCKSWSRPSTRPATSTASASPRPSTASRSRPLLAR